MVNAADQRHGFAVQTAGTEITGHAVFKIFGFADVQQLVIGGEHTIHPGTLGQGVQECFDIETGHQPATTGSASPYCSAIWVSATRSEERRVGKEWRSRWRAEH